MGRWNKQNFNSYHGCQKWIENQQRNSGQNFRAREIKGKRTWAAEHTWAQAARNRSSEASSPNPRPNSADVETARKRTSTKIWIHRGGDAKVDRKEESAEEWNETAQKDTNAERTHQQHERRRWIEGHGLRRWTTLTPEQTHRCPRRTSLVCAK